MIEYFRGMTKEQLESMKEFYKSKLIYSVLPAENMNADFILGRDALLKEMIIEIEQILLV